MSDNIGCVGCDIQLCPLTLSNRKPVHRGYTSFADDNQMIINILSSGFNHVNVCAMTRCQSVQYSNIQLVLTRRANP